MNRSPTDIGMVADVAFGPTDASGAVGVDPKWQECRDRLVGTCDSALDYEDLFDMTAFTDWIDQEIFLCTQCNWWCEIHEEASDDYGLDEWTCKECCDDG